MPAPPRRDASDERRPRGGLLPWVLGGMFGLLGFAVLVIVTMGQILPVLAVAVAILGFAAFHYVVWGWWLSGRIRDEVEAEEREDDGKA